jgi:putative CocE/NonD family hydrolase
VRAPVRQRSHAAAPQDPLRLPANAAIPPDAQRPLDALGLDHLGGPDPAYWLKRGYVVINADLRGWGTSEGEPDLLSEQEGLDIYDLVEWAAQQPWSTGRVGMSGVSYLAVSQWIGAATRPPHLCAICPWEAFTDFYRDFARPGGILESGFLTLWGTMTKRGSHGKVDIRGEAHDRPLFDD